MSGWYGGFRWAPYVPVAKRRENARRKMAARMAKGEEVCPVHCEGRTIASSFWGKGWCDHIESFSDFENRLPRGRSYVRNGSVCHLGISRGKVTAFVAGSHLYTVKVAISPLPAKRWREIRRQCGGRIGTLVELLQGRISDHVMGVVTDRKEGLFPRPGEMRFSCSCPDWAGMCKHVAATLYGVGARLDQKPELLFELRGVDVGDLIDAGGRIEIPAGPAVGEGRRISEDRFGEVFGIEVDAAGTPPASPARGDSPKVGKNRKRRSPARPKKAQKADRKKDAGRGKKAEKKPSGPRKGTRKKPAKKTPRRAASKRPASAAGKAWTGAAVKRLRRQLRVDEPAFAKLAKVSAATVRSWEKSSGPLNLSRRALDTLEILSRVARSLR